MSTRQMLVVKLHCALCNTPLEFTKYEGIPPSVHSQPTGSAMVELALSVEQCNCTGKETQRLKDALKGFLA